MEERACQLALYLIENRATVRAAAGKFGVSKSTVHKDLSERLPAYNRALYLQVKEVLEENGIAVEDKYIKAVDNTIEGGYLGAKKMVADGPPRAIFATSDDIAYGVMDAIKDMGMKVPDDVAVVGFGNARMSNLVEPKLTTVELPFHKMGIYGARLLFDLIEDEEKINEKPRQITLQTKQRIRKSCGHKERIGEMF